MPGKQKSDLSYDEKAEQNDIYAIIDKMSPEDVAMNHEEMVSDMATAEIAERLRNMTRDEWDAMEEATANQLVGVAAAEAEEDPNMMKFKRQSAKEVRAAKAEETREAARVAMAMARAVRAADRTNPDVVVGELSAWKKARLAREKAKLYAHPPGKKWKMLEVKSKHPGSSSRDPGSSSSGMGRKLYKTRNKKSRRGRQGKRTRRARISRIARRTRRARK
jgi:hypothetical protein